MKFNKLSMFYCNQIKHPPLCLLKKAYFNMTMKRNFSLGSCFLNNKCIITKNSELSFTGIENIQTLRSISKKNNKLSIVDEKDLYIVEDLKKGNLYYPYKSPADRGKKILTEMGKIFFRRAFKFLTHVELGKLEFECFSRSTDILIIGGGPVGLLIAHAFRTQCPHGPKVTVMDKNDRFPYPSINLGQGIVTQQVFGEEEEIPMLKYGIEFFSSFSEKTQMFQKNEFRLPYDPLGSLILADVTNAEQLLKNNEILKTYGVRNKIINVEALKENFPWLNLDNVLFGSLGLYNEGVIDPWKFLYGIKGKCINSGVDFVKAEVIDFGYDIDVKRAICKLPDGSYNSIDFSYCVIACGIESLNLVNVLNRINIFTFGLNLPLEERMRYEYCFYTPNGPGINTPTVVDSEGTYLRREGLTGHYVAGVPSVVCNEGECSPYQIFESKVKPFLMERVPQINRVDLVKGWIDLHDFCFSNQVGITGPHPDTNRIIFALGFSHHGLILLPALARGVMEYVLYDDYQTVDFTPFHVENLWKKRHLEADRIKKELLEAEERIALKD